jgi:DNA-binding response OmpR family regulator
MHRLDESEVLQKLRQGRSWIHGYLQTMIGEAGERVMVLRERFDDYLNEPFDLHEIGANKKIIPWNEPENSFGHIESFCVGRSFQHNEIDQGGVYS